MPEVMVHSRFFEDLGRVLYVLAIGDGTVQDRERAIVEQMIDETLRAHPAFAEDTQLKNAVLTRISFRNAIRDGVNSPRLIDHFSHEVIEHRDRIGRESLEFAWSLVKRLLDSWKGTNKAEQEQLQHFHRVFFGKDEDDGL